MPALFRPQTFVQVSRRPAVQRSPVARIETLAPNVLWYGPDSQHEAYLDYARRLTREGGVLITYKDIDTRWCWWAWRAFAWSVATGFDAWIAFDQSPLQNDWLNVLCWLVATGLNILVVWASIAIRRQIEIRPDCLILDGSEVFWRSLMDGGLPELQPKDEETFILCGVYGTRLVEYGILRRFDKNDRQPEAFAAHFQMAVAQLWTP